MQRFGTATLVTVLWMIGSTVLAAPSPDSKPPPTAPRAPAAPVADAPAPGDGAGAAEGSAAAPPPATPAQRKRTRELAGKLTKALSREHPSTAAIAALLEAPLGYVGMYWDSESCGKAFGVRGTVTKPKLASFAACLADSTLVLCRAVIEDAAEPEVSTPVPPICVMRLATARAGQRLIRSIEVGEMNLGVEGGSEAGSSGGVLSGTASAPPPPPPPPPPPVDVPVAEIRRRLIAGTLDIPPDRATQAAIAAAGAHRVDAEAKLCFARDGTHPTMAITKASGYPAWDEAIIKSLRTCRVQPRTENPSRECTTVSLHYKR